MATVGVIANSAAGKDIRRLVAQGRFVPNQEKVNILGRVFAGLDAVGVERVVIMPDLAMLGRGAMDGADLSLKAEFLDMPVFNEERDTTLAAELMRDMGVGCIVTLGGDGTNRAVAKGSGDVPLVAVSTGTNNVFPQMVEGTVAGLAAGVVALGLVDRDRVTRVSPRLEVYIDGELRDIALVDLAVSREQFVGARAVWEMDTIVELYLSRAEPGSIGLSAIGAQLGPRNDHEGVRIKLGPGGQVVSAPVAPGMVVPVHVAEWSTLRPGEKSAITLRPCTIALDGERTFVVLKGQQAHVCMSDRGPRVVEIDAALREAASQGVFLSKHEA